MSLFKRKEKKKILVAMSGGLDSSVVAKLLKDEGHEVAGAFLRLWQDMGINSSSQAEIEVKRIAAEIGIPLHIIDYRQDFKEIVVDNFLNEYDLGRTPNPCVVCNKFIKVDKLLSQTDKLGYDYLATGHYLKIKKVGSEYQLFKAKDAKKDQTYFLYTFTQKELSRLLFPLAKLNKNKVKKIALKFNILPKQKESQDICFLSGDHNDFLKKNLELKPGEIINLDSGEKIGIHQGLSLYTIGQRRGLVGGTGPYYVAKFDYEKNILYVVKEWNQDVLYRQDLIASQVNWLGEMPAKEFNCQAVIRYGHKAVNCKVSLKEGDVYYVKFNTKQRAVTPGQSIVFYKKDRMLGGGIINLS